MRSLLIALVLAIAGCQQLPPSPQELQARKFEPLPDKAVIYLVRDAPDLSDREATVWLDGAATIRTYPGTYYRWETAPGERKISGYGADTGAITVKAEAGRVYVVQQRLTPFASWAQSFFQAIDVPAGRAIAARSTLLEPR